MSRSLPRPWRLGVLAVCLGVVGAGCGHQAVKPSWTYTDFKEVTFDPFPGMASQGRPLELTPDELKGRSCGTSGPATTRASGTGWA